MSQMSSLSETNISFVKFPSRIHCRCWKCNSTIHDDYPSRLQHAKMCYGGHKAADKARNMATCMEDFFYDLKATPLGLHIIIGTPAIMKDPQDLMTRCQLLTYMEVVLCKNSKEKIYLHGEPEEWADYFERIRNGKIKPLRVDSYRSEVNKVFPGVLDYYSLDMLVHLHQSKGFFQNTAISQDHVSGIAFDYNDYYMNEPLFIGLYEYEDQLLLEIMFPYKKSVRTIFLSENYYYSNSDDIDFSLLFQSDEYKISHHDLFESDLKNLKRFSDRYPSFGLSYFLDELLNHEARVNLLIPLLSSNYHKGMEILTKSGCVNAALYGMDTYLNRSIEAFSSPKSMYDLPVRILRKLEPDCYANPSVLRQLRRLYSLHPDLLFTPRITPAMAELLSQLYLHEGIGLPSRKPIPTSVTMDFMNQSVRISLSQVRNMLRYLNDNPQAPLKSYSDYICISLLLDHKVDYFPVHLEMDLKALFKELAKKAPHITDPKEYKFQTRVSSYKKLEMYLPEQEDAAKPAAERYFIISPRCSNDLIKEGQDMHNCLSTYVDNVCDGSSKILFLRRESEPHKAYVALEVNRRGKLVQAKARYNRHASTKVQLFIRQWCQMKGIDICTDDLEETA